MPSPQKLPPQEKSRSYAFRLDPKDSEGAWAIDQINRWLSLHPGGTIKDLFFEMLSVYLDTPRPKTEAKIKAADVRSMMKMLQQINDRIQSGQWVAAGSGQPGQADDLNYDDGLKAMINHYAGLPGITGDEEDE